MSVIATTFEVADKWHRWFHLREAGCIYIGTDDGNYEVYLRYDAETRADVVTALRRLADVIEDQEGDA
jgi:hypothetical protein